MVRSRTVKGGSGEGNQRLQADSGFCVLELRQGAESLGVNVQLYHIEDLVVKGTGDGDGVSALLAVAAKDEQTGVVLLGEELKRRGIFEGVDGVLLVELDAERALERVQVRHGEIDNLGRRRVAQEKRHLVALVHLRRLFLHEALAARSLGLAGDFVSCAICGNSRATCIVLSIFAVRRSDLFWGNIYRLYSDVEAPDKRLFLKSSAAMGQAKTDELSDKITTRAVDLLGGHLTRNIFAYLTLLKT